MKVNSPSQSSFLSNEDIIKQWLQGYAKGSVYTYTYSYQFFMEVLNHKPLVDLTQDDILFVQDEISTLLNAAETQNAKRTIRSKGVGIRSLLNHLFRNGLIPEDLASIIDLKHPELIEPFQEMVIDYQFVDIWSLRTLDPQQRMLFWLVVFVRLPIIDVLAMTWADFDEDTRSIRIIGRDERVTRVNLDAKVWGYLLEIKEPNTYQFDPVFDEHNKLSAKRTIDRLLRSLGFADGIKCLSNPNRQAIFSPVFSLLS